MSLSRTVLVALLALILPKALDAQIPAARIEGTVQNSAGTGIAGAAVTATLTGTPWSTRVETDDGGRFSFPALPPGSYTVTAQAKGLRPVTHEGVPAVMAGAVAEDFVLTPGEATEGETVQARQGRLDTLESAPGGAFLGHELGALPLLDRNPLDLAVFQAGVEIRGGDSGSSHVNGNRLGSNNVTLDGLDVNDAVEPRLGLSVTGINPDSIGLFSVVTSLAKAEFGRNAGAQVLLSTRGGETRWHGSAFDYFRNKALNANDFFNNSGNLSRPKYNQNRFGVSAGGPVGDSGIFVLGNYEGRRTAHETVRNRTVLTAEAREGIFRWTAPGGSSLSSFDIVRNDPRGLGIDPQVASVLKLMPEPNNEDVGDTVNTAGYRFNSGDGSHSDQVTFRADRAVSPGHHLFFRYNWSDISGVDAAADARYPDSAEGTTEQRSQGFAGGSDWVVSPRTVNQFRAGYRTAEVNLDRPARLSGPMFLANSWTDPVDPSFGRRRNSPVTQFEDNLTQARGNHTLKAGADFRYTRQKSSNQAGTWPDVTLARANGNVPATSIGPSGSTITQSDRQVFENLYNDLLGRMDRVTQTFYGDLQSYLGPGSAGVRDFAFREYGVFLQDDWKFRPNVTLNVGVRYELGGVPSERDGIIGALDQAGSIGPTAHIANFTVQRGSAWYKKDANNFAPRAGFAWSPRNSSKMVVRGGFGLFFDRLPGTAANFVNDNTPGSFVTVTSYPNAAGGDLRLSDGVPSASPPGTPVLTLPSTRSTSAAVFLQDLETGYVRHFNLSIQREVVRDTFLEVGYAGQRGRSLFMNADLNQLKIDGGFLQAFKEIQNFRAGGTPVSSTNALVKMFGSVGAAVRAMGGSALDQGLAGSAADTVDRLFYGNYASASVSDFYLRNFPQYDRFVVGTNDGRSSYDSLQVSARRISGPLKVYAHYTWSKSLDNVPGGNCAACALPIDSFVPEANRAPSDTDRPRVFNSWLLYMLPRPEADANVFKRMISGWTVGVLSVWENGERFSVSSGLETARAGIASRADYAGSNKAGALIRASDGVYWFSADDLGNFSLPAAGQVGSSGRNAFIGPNYFNFDMSLVKSFAVRGRSRVSVRAEVYNVLNHTNFGVPGSNLSELTSFGRFSSVRGYPRQIQAAVRFDF